jgi:hypothetical protein
MEVRVTNRLPSGLANVDPYVVARRHVLRLDVATHCRYETPDRRQFLLRQSEEISFVSPWNNEAVSIAQRKGVEECHGKVVCDDEVFAAKAFTEHAIQRWGPYRAHPRGPDCARSCSL